VSLSSLYKIHPQPGSYDGWLAWAEAERSKDQGGGVFVFTSIAAIGERTFERYHLHAGVSLKA
jgi:hypothetical protein